MGRDLQKRKRRSSRTTIRQSTQPKRALNPLGNSTVAKNWNKKETLTQNYRRLGLTARLKASTGGEEKSVQAAASEAKPARNTLAIKSGGDVIVTEARVERDEDGKVVKVHHAKVPRSNPLNDPLNALESDEEDGAGEKHSEWAGIDEEERPEVIRLLEEEASRPVEKKPRHQSEQEREWLERLISKHGDNTMAMARDRKLNPMQQTQADITRRIKKWRIGG